MRGRCNPSFAALLRSAFRPEDLDEHPWPVFGLEADGTLAYVNLAWDAFALANGGEPEVSRAWNVGSNFFAAVAEPLHPFFRALFERATGERHALQPAEHVYECSSSQEFRQFSMQVFPLAEGAGFVVLNSLVTARPHDHVERPPHPADIKRYADVNGLMHQCAHCRRMRRADDPDRWDWVPAWIDARQRDISHGICPLCYAYYYTKRRSWLT